jgi:putative FmdB family regulatory protein
MPKYDFYCFRCNRTTEFSTPQNNKYCKSCGGEMSRVFSPQNTIIHRSSAEYIERAVEGKETVPGMTTEEVRKTVECSYED